MNRTINRMISSLIVMVGVAVAMQVTAQVTLYEHEGFNGRSFHSDRPLNNLDRLGFNDRASSVVIDAGDWQVCEDAGFSGRCVVLRPGRYGSLAAIGLNDRISSMRVVDKGATYENDRRYTVAPIAYDDPRRPDDRLYEVPVTSVHAVVGPPEQRCWIEREQVAGDGRGSANVAGAIAGAVIGGVLGHQIGSGRGNDVATAGGAVAGAAVGANVGRTHEAYDREVQRCANVAQPSRPAYWDVTYTFNGAEHRIQTNEPPGATITVNGDGEPRG